MSLKEDIEFNLDRGAIQIAKKLASALLKQEHRADFDRAKQADYDTIYKTVNVVIEEELDEDGNIITEASSYLEYVEDAPTFSEWLNETKVISEEVQEVSHIDDDGIKVIDTPYQAEVTEMVRPYIPLEITNEMLKAYPLIAEKLAEQAKADKIKAIATLKVTTKAGNEFDANNEARANINEALKASSILGLDKTNWKLANNEIVEVTVAELEEALALGIQAKGAVILG